MKRCDYYPYLCRADAIEEYRSLRSEILESQKQRISLLQYSMIIIGALFGYLVSDKDFSTTDCLFLVVLSIAPALFSYSTRCRERRIASYLEVYLGNLSPWSGLSSSNPEVSLGFLQRSSTTIIVFVILLDIAFLGSSWPFPPFGLSRVNVLDIPTDQLCWMIALGVSALNAYIAYLTSRLPDYKTNLQAALNSLNEKNMDTTSTSSADTAESDN